MKNVETHIPAIVEQLSCEPDLSSLDEPVEVWTSGLRLFREFVADGYVGFFGSESEACEFRGRNIHLDPTPAQVKRVTFFEREQLARLLGRKKICQLNGKGEVLRTWVVE